MGEIAVMDSADRMQFRPENERRQFRRFPMHLVVQARRDDLVEKEASDSDARPEQSVALRIQDFSLGGMRGSSSMALRRDERLTLVVPPFGTRPQIDVTGRVVRCEQGEGGFDVGIEFCQTRDEPESCPWLRIPDLFYMAGEANQDLQ